MNDIVFRFLIGWLSLQQQIGGNRQFLVNRLATCGKSKSVSVGRVVEIFLSAIRQPGITIRGFPYGVLRGLDTCNDLIYANYRRENPAARVQRRRFHCPLQ